MQQVTRHREGVKPGAPAPAEVEIVLRIVFLREGGQREVAVLQGLGVGVIDLVLVRLVVALHNRDLPLDVEGLTHAVRDEVHRFAAQLQNVLNHVAERVVGADADLDRRVHGAHGGGIAVYILRVLLLREPPPRLVVHLPVFHVIRLGVAVLGAQPAHGGGDVAVAVFHPAAGQLDAPLLVENPGQVLAVALQPAPLRDLREGEKIKLLQRVQHIDQQQRLRARLLAQVEEFVRAHVVVVQIAPHHARLGAAAVLRADGVRPQMQRAEVSAGEAHHGRLELPERLHHVGPPAVAGVGRHEGERVAQHFCAAGHAQRKRRPDVKRGGREVHLHPGALRGKGRQRRAGQRLLVLRAVRAVKQDLRPLALAGEQLQPAAEMVRLAAVQVFPVLRHTGGAVVEIVDHEAVLAVHAAFLHGEAQAVAGRDLGEIRRVGRDALGPVFAREGIPPAVLVSGVVPLLLRPVVAQPLVVPAEPVIRPLRNREHLLKAAVVEHLRPHALHLVAESHLDEVAAQQLAGRCGRIFLRRHGKNTFSPPEFSHIRQFFHTILPFSHRICIQYSISFSGTIHYLYRFVPVPAKQGIGQAEQGPL